MTTAREIHVSMFCNLIGGALFRVPHCNTECALTLPGPPFVRWVGPGDEATTTGAHIDLLIIRSLSECVSLSHPHCINKPSLLMPRGREREGGKEGGRKGEGRWEIIWCVCLSYCCCFLLQALLASPAVVQVLHMYTVSSPPSSSSTCYSSYM